MGVESTFDIVFEDTGDVIACLFYWDEQKETEADTRLLVEALDRLFRRGGYLSVDALQKLADELERLYFGEGDDPRSKSPAKGDQ